MQERFGQFKRSEISQAMEQNVKKRDYRILVAENTRGTIVGHSIVAIKKDQNGQSFGLCYARYVDPRYRRSGIASQLLEEAEKWWTKRKVSYIVAHSHTKNKPIKNLFRKFGYNVSRAQNNGTYKFNLLQKDLTGPPDSRA